MIFEKNNQFDIENFQIISPYRSYFSGTGRINDFIQTEFKKDNQIVNIDNLNNINTVNNVNCNNKTVNIQLIAYGSEDKSKLTNLELLKILSLSNDSYIS